MDYVRVNKLWVKPQYSTSAVQPYTVQLGYNKKYRLTKGNTVVWDVLKTTFNAYDFTIGAEGGYVPNYSSVDSYGVNYLNQIEYLDWDCDTYWIDENTSTSPVTHYITYTQEGTGQQVTVVCTQEGKQQDITITGYRYDAVVTKEDIGKAPATNDYTTLSLKVSGTVYIYEQYSNNTEAYYGSQNFNSITAYVYDGSSTTGAYTETGNVIVPPVGTTTYTGDRVVFTITKYDFNVLDKSFHKTTSKDVYQAENKITGQEWGTSASDYSLSISSSVSSFTSNGGTSTISVQCQQQYRDIYTSGSKGAWVWGNGTASISTSYGSLDKSSITGSGTATLLIGKDYGTGTTAVVIADAGNGTKTATVSITQAKREPKETVYNQPTVTTTSIVKASVKGSTLSLFVSWSQTTTIKYDNVTTGEGTEYNGTSVATVTNGSSNIGAKIVNGKIEVPSAGTDYYTSDRVAFTITAYSYEAKSGTWSESANISVLQEKNGRTQKYEYEIILGTPSPSIINNVGGTFSFSATSRYRYKYTYDSGDSNYSDYADTSANVTYSDGVSKVSASSFSGTTTITATVSENYFGTRNPNVTVKSSGDASVVKTVQVVQNAASFEFVSHTLSESMPYEGGTISLSVISRVNGKACNLTSVTSSLAGITISNPTLTDSSGEYTFSVTAGKNTTGAIRTFEITAVQQYSNDTKKWTISQAAQAVVVKDKVNTVVDAQFTGTGYNNVTYSVYFDATNTSKYDGGTINDVTVEINTTMNGSANPIASVTLSSSIYIAKGSKSQTYSGTFNNTTGNSLVYFIVRYDNKVQFSRLLMSTQT